MSRCEKCANVVQALGKLKLEIERLEAIVHAGKPTPSLDEDAIANPSMRGAHETEIDKKIKRHTSLKGQTSARNGKSMSGLKDHTRSIKAKIDQKVQLDGPANAGRKMQAKRDAQKTAKANLACEAQEIADFIKDLLTTKTVNESKIQALSDKALAKSTLDRLFDLSLCGWTAKQDKIINESVNRTVPASQYSVDADGYLISVNDGRRVTVDFDSICDARLRLRKLLEDQNVEDFAIIDESLRNLRG